MTIAKIGQCFAPSRWSLIFDAADWREERDARDHLAEAEPKIEIRSIRRIPAIESLSIAAQPRPPYPRHFPPIPIGQLVVDVLEKTFVSEMSSTDLQCGGAMIVREGTDSTRTSELESSIYSAHVLSSQAEIERLANESCPLWGGRESIALPRFFLASVDARSWVPRVIVVRRDGATAGIVYAKERKFAGVPTGVIYADAALDSMVVAAVRDRERVLEIAIRRLRETPGCFGLRLSVRTDGFEYAVVNRMLPSLAMDVHCGNVENHAVLDLPRCYESFLENLGQKTRRNFRYYRRRSEALDRRYIAEVPLPEFRAAARGLLKKSVIRARRNGVARALRMFAEVDRPILVGLRNSTGEWLSILGGWYESDHAVIFLQMNNDRDYPESSLCTVLRGYLIENAILRGATAILFWSGVSAPLSRYCRFLPTIGVHLDVTGFVWRNVRRALAGTARFLPPRFRLLVNWIAVRPVQETTN